MKQNNLPEPYCTRAYRGKTILITGSVGTVGSQLLNRLIEYNPAEIRLLDNNESGLYFQAENSENGSITVPILGDIRDSGKLRCAIRGVNVVFHLAAYKHVTLCEGNPFDAVRTNVIGTQNALHAALEAGVDRFLYTSSDKAANPTNVMGTSKLLAERVVTASSLEFGNGNRRKAFSVSRFGNVLGSNGSVIPIFAEQIRRGGPVTLTNESMTRFIMTVEDSAELILTASALAEGGEVFITKMRVVRIPDLAHAMIEILAPFYGHSPDDVAIRVIGARPGEKIYEELMTEEEGARALELEKMFVILPALGRSMDDRYNQYPGLITNKVTRPYASRDETPMTKAQIIDFLLTNNILGSGFTHAHEVRTRKSKASPRVVFGIGSKTLSHERNVAAKI